MYQLLNKIYVSVLLLASYHSIGQTYVIPDAALFNRIKSVYPGVINGSNELIIANANAVQGPFDINGLGIIDLNGMQFFTQLDTFYNFNNPQSNLEPITSMIGLKKLFIYGHNSTTLPTNIINLTQLESLVDEENNLTSLPSLVGLNALKELKVWKNNITHAPDLSSLNNLKIIDFNDNPLQLFPSLGSNKPFLQILNLNGSAFSELGPFPIMPMIDTIRCGWGQVDFCHPISHLTNLKVFRLNNNLLNSLPDFSGLTNLTKVDLRNNQLTFEDIIPLVSHPLYNSAFSVFPQDSIGPKETTTQNEGSSYTFNLNVDETTLSNSYDWYKDGAWISTTTKNCYTINQLRPTDAGEYYCIISNNSQPVLIGKQIVSYKNKLIVNNSKATSQSNKEIAITPNGDGQADVFYCDEIALGKIYDRFGKVIKEVQFPGYWDGTDKNGNLVSSGYYIINLDTNKSIPISVIR
jgi:gliding motility-associated-like protein